ncbi:MULTISPECIES: DNA mismatch repair endonuclease MutL [Peptostreptococcus]|uniref:DNA mismatch repair protein MutL n=1 Tax=Peptostreptococcus anaerobius TaxID=1261 RepID=A0A135YNC0_9FIRM|nr:MULTISPECIES: DNA mismatch repair endonuclease MutL [Peptostreptococcus]KXI10851.1 DNA mismatch repair protein [Peptostreptococcus anaerobius]MCB6982458.1 DNA mismatch repair endonuclease MutL [Peptostreptococcus anaerobius]MCQ5150350.1 DNA mismatch repair endonuclease MutL [Peptostreptococcus anaerobius]MDB8820680.1 DNA mismatch repair endonuclease MutL [Peptostreptococcus anaerobius]MDB8825319.1 DNA mismatch repair endonuclease MutL [Peptostreptococcus anaerobius]
MAKINILDDSTINKIAAGEVVERPSSIIKELVENSIDAGSSYISIEIENGGKGLIRIVDNGSGIDKDDVNKAFLRHATSKINTVEDLSSLESLGFRGEALASIAAVSKLEMLTKTEEALIGLRIVLDGGKIREKEATSANRGTQISVRDLFFNTPARRKFLKSNQAEAQAITDIVNKIAIGNPSIKIKYINNSKTIYETLGDGSIINAIRMIYGRDISENLIEIDYRSKYFSISGYLGNNNIYRGNRNHQHLYINGRYIKSPNISKKINDAYKAIIPINKYPIYFVNISVDPAKVDVNIHPSKLEVKFDQEEEILNELSDFVRGILLKSSLVGRYKNNSRGKDLYNKNSFAGFNSFSYSPQEAENNLTSTAIREDVSNSCSNQNTNESPRVQADMIQTPIRLSDINNGGIQDKKEVDSKMEYQQSSFIEESPDRNPDFIGLKFIGIIFDTYIIFSKNDDMIMLDQHAAHERIRFEMYMSKYKANDISVQMLIDPIIMDLDANDMDTVRKNIDVFSSFGFLVEEFGHRSISIRGLPNTFGEPESKRFIYELIDGLGKIDNIYDTKYDEIAEIACKSAIKGNDKISIEEAKHLIGQLEECSNPYTCPHGRPTMVKMTRYEIEKLFKRRM